MAEITAYAPGTFCWVDLGTTDAAAAKTFYTQLFGWDAVDVPAGDMGIYTMLQKNGHDVCALYAMTTPGVPSAWLSYVSVDQVEAIAEQVTALGGTVMQPPCNVMESGRMALIQDPEGAVFALWEPKQHLGATLVNEPSTLCWNELQVRHPEQTAGFYEKLFGWSTKGSLASEGYLEFMQGDRPMAGSLQIQPSWGEMPANWAVYFAVADCDATVDQAKALGGSVVMPATTMENVGRLAGLLDPQGACFYIIQLAT